MSAARWLALALWVLTVGIVVLGSIAFAGGPLPPARVALLGPSEQDATVVRLRQELGILGVEVAFVPWDGRRDLAEAAREQQASAAAAVVASPPAVLLWIDPARQADPTAGAGIRVDEGLAGSREPRLLALRAIEILRGRLLPVPAATEAGAGTADATPASGVVTIGTSPPSPGTTVASPPSLAGPTPLPASPDADAGTPGARDAGAAPARGPSAFLGPSVLASPGGVGVMAPIWLGVRWAPVSLVDLELLGFLPATSATVSAPEGSTTLRAGGLGAGASVRLTGPAANLFATAGAGLGVMLAAFSGQASPPWQAASGVRPLMLPYVHASAGYWLAPRVGVRADVLAGFALPEPVLTIAGKRVAAFGEPAVLFAGAIEVRP